ncbi:hypothetical protein HS1genome_0591 [Sulfodiicoccus acidiphilus]|uniref:Uncharacterized protein n=1 Tax=Sulfodiicoccus acidiphilus TaxID=1670455 RepID=A0A348B200_9CREN|nr:DUF5305 family protein [Sulfodiicoccus acidiphilus]BBD72202.1 hypothetical protein HS1genome_0591 [Sulfodiicoccus acidiphilus]GGU03078.1 hypothetical protein GCM10007116_20120 [Sulfodiicoccus acidiphilus]
MKRERRDASKNVNRRNLKLGVRREVRVGATILLVLGLLLIGGLVIYPSLSYTPRTYQVEDGYRTIAYAQLSSQAIVYPNHIYNTTRLVSGYTANETPAFSLGLETWATLKPNLLYTSLTLYNSSLYFTKIVDLLYVSLVLGNRTVNGNYTVSLVAPGYYQKSLYTVRDSPVVVPLNLSYILNVSEKINSQLGISPPLQVRIASNVTALNYTLEPVVTVNIGDSVTTVYLANSTAFRQIKIPNYEYITSNDYNQYFEALLKVLLLNVSESLGQAKMVNYSVFIVTPQFVKLVERGENLGQWTAIPLNMTEINNFSETLNKEVGTYYFPPDLRIDVSFDGPRLDPVIYVNYTNGLVQATISNNSISEPIYITQTTPRPNPVPSIGAESALGIALGFVALGTFTKVEPLDIREVKRFSSKYRKLIVDAKSPPDVKSAVELGSPEDLAKYAMLTGRPMVMLRRNGGVELWFKDQDVAYVYKFRNGREGDGQAIPASNTS